MRIVLLFLLLAGLEARAAYLGDISTTYSVTNLTALQALVVPDKTPVLLKGYYVEGDAPAVTYIFVAGDTSTVDNGSVVTNAAGRFKIQPQGGRVDIRTFGAIGDWLEIGAVWTNTAGVTNITLASAPATNYVGKKIALRRGNTSVGAEVTLLATDLSGTVISSFTVVSNGQGYINIPTNVLVSGPGSGATTTCVLTNGRLSSITVTGGGTGYTTNSVFKIRSTDCGTTNAPFYTELFSVSNQVGTTIGLSGTPTFSEPLEPYDEVGAAALYTDNQVAIQAAVDYAAANGLEVYIPKGDFGTGPVYLNQGQRIVGAGRDLATLHSAAVIGYTTFRKSVLTPKNINLVNGRQLYDSLWANVDIQGFTINGEALFQSPLGVDLHIGNFAVFGINCTAVNNWHISDMTITNCQGGAIYYGSFAPTAGTAGDWSLVRSLYIKTEKCLFAGNWRQAHQMGNVQRLVESECDILDSSYGYYASVVARNLETGTTVGKNGTYSPEQIDLEANSNAQSGYNSFVNCWMQNKYGKAADVFLDQAHTSFINCTIKDCLKGGITCSPSTAPSIANNQDGGGEWLTIQGCRFLVSSTNYYAHLTVRGRGVKVIGNYFEGKTGATTQGNPDILIDGTSYGTVVPSYVMSGIMFKDNTINLTPTDGTIVEGAISVANAANNIKNLIWRDNIILAGNVAMTSGTDADVSSVAKLSSLFPQEGYAYQTAAGGSPDYQSELSTAGFGSQDWTVLLRFGLNSSSSRNGELFRWFSGATTEIKISERTAAVGLTNLLQIDWNPSNIGARTISVPITSSRHAFPSWVQFQSPVNLAVTKTHGSVYKITITDGGSGYVTAPAVSFSSGSAAATAQISGGVVTNIYITTRGSSYTTNPVVTIAAPPAGVTATAIASAGRIDVYLDDQIIYTDYGTDVITNMLSTAGSFRIGANTGTQTRPWYSYGVWNKALTEETLRQALTFGPSQLDQWGVPGGALGCVSYIKFNSGIGYFFEDPSSQAMHVWCGQAITHGYPKRSGQLRKRLAVTGATGGTNSFNVAIAASPVIPANARITSAYVVPQSGAAPTVRLGFDSAITDQLVAPVTLTANTTNYLGLVPSMVYGSTNRPVYIGQTGAATNDIVINYSLDQGGLDGSTIQSGIVTAPDGLGSTSSIAATAIDATGWTNTFGVNAMVYAEGTGLQFTVYNAAGTSVYTNAATVGSASIALQKGGKVIVIGGTGVSGRAVPW